jgi:hypothetical protein
MRLTAALVSLLAGCAPQESLFPLFTKEDDAFAKQLLGEWKISSGAELKADEQPGLIEFGTGDANYSYDLRITANRAMPFDFDLSDALNAKPSVVQLDAVPVTRERDAVETAARLESRITSLLAMFRPAKERLVCFVHTAKDVLAAGEIRQPEVPSSTNLFQLIRLRVVVDRNSLLPRIATFLQRGVVQTACFTQLHIQQFAFEAGRE